MSRAPDRNIVGGELLPCSADPAPGFYRDGCCATGPEDLGRHTVCAVVTGEFLEHQRSIGNDRSTPMPHYRFPDWLRAHREGCAARVVLASTDERTLDVVSLEVLGEHAVDVPDDLGNL